MEAYTKMKKIPLTQGKIAIIDDCDFEWLSQWKWFAVSQGSHSKDFLAARRLSNDEKKTEHGCNIYMHREIAGLKRGDKRDVNHKGHHTIDNRRQNLRICTRKQSNGNRRPCQNTSIKFKGVCRDKARIKWMACIRVDRRQKYLGRFESEINAALAYDRAAVETFGEFALLNFEEK